MGTTKNRPEKEYYEEYWKMTAAWTDIFGIKFNNSLRVTIDFIDQNIEEIKLIDDEEKTFKGSNLYSELQDKIVKIMGWSGKDPQANARKGINQFVKLGFINPFLKGYNPLAKKYISTTDKEKKKIIFSKLFYEESDFSASITKQKSKSEQIKFLLRTLNNNRELSKEDIIALMATDVKTVKKGYLNKTDLKNQYAFCKEINFEDRKYNQISHLSNLLKKFVQVTYSKKTEKFYFSDDPNIEKYTKKNKIDQVRLRIHRQELENESISLYGEKICYLLKKNYKGLVDSHIKPKDVCLKEGNDDEAYDVNNAIWLAPHVDMYFNYFDISFDDDGKVLVGNSIPSDVSCEFEYEKLDKQIMNASRKRYMEYHRNIFLKKNGL